MEFTPGCILKLLFQYTHKNQRYLADHYIYCDRTLVYKWVNDTVTLPKKHVAAIVRFVLEQTLEAERFQIRNDIETALSFTSMCERSKAALSHTDAFGEFLSASLLHAITTRLAGQRCEPASDSKVSNKCNAVQLAPHAGIRARFIICGLIAAIAGGLLWSILNRLFGWSYFMGGSGNEPQGVLSAVWGVLTGTPVIICALLSAEKGNMPPVGKKEKVLLALLFSILGGLGAFVFYNSGFRYFLEQYRLSYGVREFVIAAVYAMILSVFPLSALFILLRRFRIPLLFLPAGTLLCTFAAALAALASWTVNLPEMEVSQLRGFAVGLSFRLCLFTVTYLFLSGRLRLSGSHARDTEIPFNS